MSQSGYILISDITGYTHYLSDSELEHAEEVLRTLLEVILEETDLPLVVSRLEGDAVISYALSAGLHDGDSLVERIENTYVAFRRALQQMALNTTCGCRACANIDALDLKFFLHHGEFLVQTVRDHRELVGKDVNLTFRLTKNSIPQETGIDAYVAYTKAAIEALGMEDFAGTLPLHEESYPDVGRVRVYVQDMAALWEERRASRLLQLHPDDVAYYREEEFPVPPAVLWEYITVPELRAILFNVEPVEALGLRHGRRGEDTVYVCAHGDQLIEMRVVDWHPFRQYAYISALAGATLMTVLKLEPTADGTRLLSLFRRPRGPFLQRLLAMLTMKWLAAQGAVEKGFASLRARIAEDLEGEEHQTPEAAGVSEEHVTASVRQSLQSRTTS